MPKLEDSIRIENVVSSATLYQSIDLNAVVKGNPLVEYRPEKFPGLVFRLKKPKTAILIFSTGKMVCTGAKSENESKKAVLIHSQIWLRCKPSFPVLKIRIAVLGFFNLKTKPGNFSGRYSTKGFPLTTAFRSIL